MLRRSYQLKPKGRCEQRETISQLNDKHTSLTTELALLAGVWALGNLSGNCHFLPKTKSDRPGKSLENEPQKPMRLPITLLGVTSRSRSRPVSFASSWKCQESLAFVGFNRASVSCRVLVSAFLCAILCSPLHRKAA